MASSARGSADSAASNKSMNAALTNESSVSANASESTAPANATSTSTNANTNAAISNAKENAVPSSANDNSASSNANENVASAEPVTTSCPVCSDDYTEPKILPCAHRFCRKCLVTWFESSSDRPSCPICKRSAISPLNGQQASAGVTQEVSRNETTVKDTSSEPSQMLASLRRGACGGRSLEQTAHTSAAATDAAAVVDSLPTDMILATLAEGARKLRPPHMCSLCPENGMHAEKMCLDCGDMLCRRCSPFHSRSSATRHHEVQPVHDLTPEKLASRIQHTCKTHAGQLLELYCLSHKQLLCLMCFAISHSQCGTVESIPEAAKQQRQVLHGQIQQLAELGTTQDKTLLSIQRQEEQLSKSQAEAQKKVSLTIDRIVTAANTRKIQLMKRAGEMPLPQKMKLQQQKGSMDESRWLLSANQQLATECLQSVNDMNFLQVFGFLSERIALLASRIKEPPARSTDQRVDLFIDQYDVLRIEELLRDLGTVKVVKRCIKKKKADSSFISPAPAVSGSVTAKDFNPFRCKPRQIGFVTLTSKWNWGDLMCEAGQNMLLLYDCNDNSVYSVNTSPPFQHQVITVLPTIVQAMSCLQEGLVVMTTKAPSLLFLNVTTKPKPTVTIVPVPKVYQRITKGLEDTIIALPTKILNTLDVVTRGGQILRTLHLGPSVVSRELCRLKDYIIVSDEKAKTFLKVGLETGRTETFSDGNFCSNMAEYKLFVDHKDRLYVIDCYTSVIVMNLEGQSTSVYMPNTLGIFVNPEGFAFTMEPSSPEGETMLVYDLNKH